MIQERRAALIFPGQGLDPKDIISCYRKLQDLDKILIRERMALTQEALDRVYGTDSPKMKDVLEDETSFHTSFMSEAASQLDQHLTQYEFRNPQKKE